MEQILGETLQGQTVDIKEGTELGRDGAFVEVIVPDFRNGVHRACVRRKDNSLGVIRILESAFVWIDTVGNGKKYSDYPLDVRQKMNLFTKEEKAQQRKQNLQDEVAGEQIGRAF